MRFHYLLLPIVLLCSNCASQYGKVSFQESPKIINVSEYDPKEKHRSGRSFTPSNQAALKANGALGLIARCGKGTHMDTKCTDFLIGAEHQGMLLGSYFYVLPRSSGQSQANAYIRRLTQIRNAYPFHSQKILLVADFDNHCSIYQITSFLRQVKQLTGVTPVVYLENGEAIRRTLNNASSSDKSFLRRHPYWLALYSSKSARFSTPEHLAKGSGVWSSWAMWQYAGVWWKNGRSQPYHYSAGNWRTPRYFGNLSHPCERNGFNGTREELMAFWQKHSWAW